VLEHERAQAQHRAADLLALHDVSGLLRMAQQVHHQRLDPLRPGRPQQLDLGAREVLEAEHARPDGVVDVVVDVGHAVHQPDDPALERGGRVVAGVAQDAVADGRREVQPLDFLHHTQ
jgi:hypothetical protein